MTSPLNDRAAELLSLHRDPALLLVVNVWDAISATVVTGIEGTTALATASHSIAASRGYPDGERIPVAEMIEEVARIVAATHPRPSAGPSTSGWWGPTSRTR